MYENDGSTGSEAELNVDENDLKDVASPFKNEGRSSLTRHKNNFSNGVENDNFFVK